ncbi:MAG: PilZ domain-containing protein [Planctomycetaceae bacterium]|nr:PilZ domain-containing protein [Planctomycetaceae bacterium]MCA9023223.1 PilZ domain-containing protein [Planctomycetaceae bacterium]
MNILMDVEPQVVPDENLVTTVTNDVEVVENVESRDCVPSASPQSVQPISFRHCLGSARRTLKVQSCNSGCSWNNILSKVQSKSPATIGSPVQAPSSGSKSFERREFPRHTSEAIVLAFNKDEPCVSGAGDQTGAKGYAINVSQNGLSFASRSEFPLREELQLHVEDQRVKFALDVTASVVRATPLDDEFWRIDCKLITPLSDQQVALLKEHVPSCYAG